MQSLEFHVNALSEAQKEDKKCILQLKRELNNCSQEIGGCLSLFLIAIFSIVLSVPREIKQHITTIPHYFI